MIDARIIHVIADFIAGLNSNQEPQETSGGYPPHSVTWGHGYSMCLMEPSKVPPDVCVCSPWVECYCMEEAS